MTDLASTKIFEAEILAEDARARAAAKDEFFPTLAMNYCTNLAVLASDALCHAVNVPPARRHGESTRVNLEFAAK